MCLKVPLKNETGTMEMEKICLKNPTNIEV